MNRFNPCQFYKIVNYFGFFLLINFTFVSCTGIRTIPPAEFMAIDQNFSGTFTNNVCKFRGVTEKDNMLELFAAGASKEEKLKISFDSIGRLKLASLSEDWSAEFNGKFKRGFYQVYLRKKRIEIPPFFPFIYSDVDVYRLRIAFHPYGYLMVENNYFKGKSIFFLGGGRGQRNLYFFSPDSCN
ncbi:hypothetical protein CNR22_00505 [Sphingobacteriaceae bacterium]|nr:hypothetical protein CNR22_00505 [Sphingobacteriaceae bacterium]